VIHLDVSITLVDGVTVPVGELACTDADEAGRFQSEFAYADAWLARRDRFALDPVSLALRQGTFPAIRFEPPLAVFDDALPDDWGRHIIVRSQALPRTQRSEPHLLRELAHHGLGLGALVFAEHGKEPTARAPAPSIALADLVAAAERFEAGVADDVVGLRLLFAAGSSVGGARPKALVCDADGNWIAKFPSAQRDGRFDVVGLEATGLDLAAMAGIPVPDHRLVDLGKRKRALLVRRFDLSPQGGRRHMISLRTLCKERPGLYAQSYTELAEVVRKVSGNPVADVQQLFRQMVFNAALGNTDDHLKNFWMLHDANGYRLSEAFDLLPDLDERREHVLSFEYDRSAPTRNQLLAVGAKWGVAKATDVVDAVVAAVREFGPVARRNRVPAANVRELARPIQHRLALLDAA
jgi:serine/threonine-protein kinase HipA